MALGAPPGPGAASVCVRLLTGTSERIYLTDSRSSTHSSRHTPHTRRLPHTSREGARRHGEPSTSCMSSSIWHRPSLWKVGTAPWTATQVAEWAETARGFMYSMICTCTRSCTAHDRMTMQPVVEETAKDADGDWERNSKIRARQSTRNEQGYNCISGSDGRRRSVRPGSGP